VLVQYTALAWSTRGFPQRFLRIVQALGDIGSRVCVVYHDVEPYGGLRIVDRLRRRAQLSTMRACCELRMLKSSRFLECRLLLGKPLTPLISFRSVQTCRFALQARKGMQCEAERFRGW
jgi:hypothetical protein